jgi:hypothetical protein
LFIDLNVILRGGIKKTDPSMKTIYPLSLITTLTLTLTLTLLTACGGGGSGSSAPTVQAPKEYYATCENGTRSASLTSEADAAARCFGDTGVYPSSIVTSVPASTYDPITQA